MDTKIPIFRKFVIQNFPYIEEDFDALTDYALFSKVVEYLNKCIAATNQTSEQMAILKDYVDHYFDNLDIQTEINNKLEEMAQSGELADIIAQYVQLQSVLAFDTVADMQNGDNLVNGSLVETYGFYAKGDGGGAKYQIRLITNDDTIDNMFLFEITADPTNTLVAELIVEENENVLQFGIKNDGETDSTTKMQTLIDRNIPIILVDGEYLVTGSLTGAITIKGQSQNSVIYGGTTKHNVIDCSDITSSDKVYLSNIAFRNATLSLYTRDGNNDLLYTDYSDERNIYAENVWFDEPVAGDGSTFWGLYIKTPKPEDYTRYGNSGYACYPVEIVNNSGYNALMINNICTNSEGTAQAVADNSAIGIIDKVDSSAPTIFVVQKKGRNFIGLNNGNAAYNVDGRVVEISSAGHMALGCKVAADETRPGWATLKLNDETPNIIFYSNRDGETTSNYGMLTFGGSSAKRNFAIYVGGTELMRITNRGFMGRTFPSATIQTLPRSELIEGEQIFDTTHHKPLWYNGTVWVDGAGTTVVTPNS